MLLVLVKAPLYMAHINVVHMLGIMEYQLMQPLEQQVLYRIVVLVLLRIQVDVLHLVPKILSMAHINVVHMLGIMEYHQMQQ